MWKIMTYNIHGCVGMDKKLDIPRIAEVIRKQQVDFVCLNEVDANCARTGTIDEPAELGRILGYNKHFACALKMKAPDWPEQGDAIGEYGNAMLSPHKIEHIKTFFLPGLPTMEPRVCTIALIHAPKPFYVAATHLCWEPQYQEYRIESVKTIVKETAEYAAKYPVIICGDLNANPTDPEIELLRETFQLHGEELGFPFTHPADKPEVNIDYIGIAPRKQYAFKTMEVIPELVASDHRPLVVTIE